MFSTTQKFYYSIETAERAYTFLANIPKVDMIIGTIRADLGLKRLSFDQTNSGNEVIFSVQTSSPIYSGVNIVFNKEDMTLMLPMFKENSSYEKVVDEWLGTAFSEKLLFGTPVYDMHIWEDVPNLPNGFKLGIIHFMSKEQFEQLNNPSERRLQAMLREMDKYNL
jgi:hypothetical protein